MEDEKGMEMLRNALLFCCCVIIAVYFSACSGRAYCGFEQIDELVKTEKKIGK